MEKPFWHLWFHFQVHDQVRINKAKKTFDKRYKANWSIKTFTVAERLPRRPPVYRLEDQQGEMIERVFYEVEREDETRSRKSRFVNPCSDLCVESLVRLT